MTTAPLLERLEIADAVVRRIGEDRVSGVIVLATPEVSVHLRPGLLVGGDTDIEASLVKNYIAPKAGEASYSLWRLSGFAAPVEIYAAPLCGVCADEVGIHRARVNGYPALVCDDCVVREAGGVNDRHGDMAAVARSIAKVVA